MKILLVGSGASFSIRDVENGYREAFSAAGVEVVYFALEGRTNVSAAYLNYAWRHARKAQPELPRPSDAQKLYHASLPVLERALRYAVDRVVVVTGMFLHPQVYGLLRRAGVPTALILTEDPYDLAFSVLVAAEVDAVWTNERAALPYLRAVNPHAGYLPPAYRAGVHDPAVPPDPDLPAHDVIFVGTAFGERAALLSEVDRLGGFDGLDVAFYGAWSLLGSRSRLRRFVRDDVIDNRKAAALYRRAKVGLNLYRVHCRQGLDGMSTFPAESLNPRAVETAALGAFTIASARAEASERFGDLVPTFTTPQTLAERIAYWVEHDAERRDAAAQLPARVAGWTFDDRVRQVLADLADWERTPANVTAIGERTA